MTSWLASDPTDQARRLGYKWGLRPKSISPVDGGGARGRPNDFGVQSATDDFPMRLSLAQDWSRVRFTEEDAVSADGMTAWPGFGAAKVASINIVFDEGTDTGPDFFGMIILDNLDVNAALIGDSESTGR